MNKLPFAKRIQVVTALVEGCSIRSTVRMTGVAKNTIVKLLAEVGTACARYQHDKLRNLNCRRLQLDEIWSFVYAKAKNVPEEKQGEFGVGDVWTWVAIDAETKLCPSWLVASRDLCDAKVFVTDLAERLATRVQITSDGHKCYVEAVDEAFGGEVDFAQLIKLYGNEGNKANPETKYSPGECCGTKTKIISGGPLEEHISTSFAERQNLTMRMRMRRFTRLTNAFSKKLENHEHSVALHFMVYNFIRPHQTLTKLANGHPTTPTMAAGIANHCWTIADLLAMMERLQENESSN
jgi:IS1 family transposase